MKKEKKESKIFPVVFALVTIPVIIFNSTMALYVFFMLEFWDNKKLFFQELMYQIFN